VNVVGSHIGASMRIPRFTLRCVPWTTYVHMHSVGREAYYNVALLPDGRTKPLLTVFRFKHRKRKRNRLHFAFRCNVAILSKDSEGLKET